MSAKEAAGHILGCMCLAALLTAALNWTLGTSYSPSIAGFVAGFIRCISIIATSKHEAMEDGR